MDASLKYVPGFFLIAHHGSFLCCPCACRLQKSIQWPGGVRPLAAISANAYIEIGVDVDDPRSRDIPPSVLYSYGGTSPPRLRILFSISLISACC